MTGVVYGPDRHNTIADERVEDGGLVAAVRAWVRTIVDASGLA
jgi:hypothetical protein